jgi:hypothetical protein
MTKAQSAPGTAISSAHTPQNASTESRAIESSPRGGISSS